MNQGFATVKGAALIAGFFDGVRVEKDLACS
jgi:hypothetical protein